MFALDAMTSGKPSVPAGSQKRACTLHPIEGEGEGAPVEVKPLPFFLGKHEECNLVLAGDGIMRKHAKIRNQDGEFFITDLATYQGTFLNGQSVVESVIKDGDIVRIADHKMRVAIREIAVAPGEPGAAAVGPKPAERLLQVVREIGVGSWIALVLALVALGGGSWSYQRWQEKERLRTQDLELPAVEMLEGETRNIPVARVKTATVGKTTVASIQAVPEGVVVEARNEGSTEVSCTIPEQGKRHFTINVHRASDRTDRYPELKGVLTLSLFDRSRRAEEYLRQSDTDYAAREDDLTNRGKALHGYTLAVEILNTIQEQTTLRKEAMEKQDRVAKELDDLWDFHFSRLLQAYGNGDVQFARDEAHYLFQLFPEGSGRNHEVAKVWLDQLK